MKAPAWRDIRRIPDRIPVKFLEGRKEGDEVELPEERAREAIEKGRAEVRKDFGDLVRERFFSRVTSNATGRVSLSQEGAGSDTAPLSG